MNDIKTQPYSQWLEACLRILVDLQPASIGIVTIMPDGSTGTNYWNADNRDRLIMCEAIQIDSLSELIRVNAEELRDILLGEEDEEE